MPNEAVTKIVDVKYSCKCGTTYDSEEQAEQCSSPREPKFKSGDWVETNVKLTFGNPAYDGGFGDEDPYDHVPKGAIARIAAVYDRYDDKRARHPKKHYRYSFDNGERPMTYLTIPYGKQNS